MGRRIFIHATVDEVTELASELERIARVAEYCSEYMKSKGSQDFRTDGFNSTVEGLDAITNLLGGVVGVYNAPPAKLETIREKLRIQKEVNRVEAEAEKAAKAVLERDASKTARSAGSKTEANPKKSATKQAPQTPKTNRKKKA